MTGGITVAPTMLTASRAESPPANCGTNIPCATPPADGWLRSRSRTNANTITATNPVIAASSRRNPHTCRPRMMNAATPVSSAEIHKENPKTRCRPRAAPTNSARSVAMATASACSQSTTTRRNGRWSLHSSGRLLPVAIPHLALSDWISMAIRFAASTTHSSV